jgi:hypothetical protein
LVSFVLALGVTLLRKRDVPCFCFGAHAAEPISVAASVRAGLLLALSALGMVLTLGADLEPLRLAEVVPALTLSGSVVIAIQLVGAVPHAWRAFRRPAYVSPSGTIRISFRNVPLDFSLKQASMFRRDSSGTSFGQNGDSYG